VLRLWLELEQVWKVLWTRKGMCATAVTDGHCKQRCAMFSVDICNHCSQYQNVASETAGCFTDTEQQHRQSSSSSRSSTQCNTSRLSLSAGLPWLLRHVWTFFETFWQARRSWSTRFSKLCCSSFSTCDFSALQIHHDDTQILRVISNGANHTNRHLHICTLSYI